MTGAKERCASAASWAVSNKLRVRCEQEQEDRWMQAKNYRVDEEVHSEHHRGLGGSGRASSKNVAPSTKQRQQATSTPKHTSAC